MKQISKLKIGDYNGFRVIPNGFRVIPKSSFDKMDKKYILHLKSAYRFKI